MLKQLLKNTSWLVIAEVLNKAVFFFATFLIARVFGITAYGQFNFAFSFVLLFSVVVDFGINNTVIRDVARDKSKASYYITNGFYIKTVLSIVTAILIFVITKLLHKSAEVEVIIYLLGAYVIFNSYNTFVKAVYRAHEKMKYEAFLKIIEGVLLVVYLYFISVFLKNLNITILGFSLMSLLTLVLSLFIVNKYFNNLKFTINWPVIKELILESWPFALAGIFVTIYFNIDTVMISLIKGDAETGFYSASYNFIFAASLFPSLISAAAYPYLSKIHNSSEKIHSIKKYILLFFLFGVICSLVLFFLSTILIQLMYGAEYMPAVNSLKILSLILPFSFVCTFMGTFLASVNKQFINTLITLLTAILNITLNVVLIRLYGQNGAATASLISFVIMFLVSIMAYRHYVRHIPKIS